MLRVFQGPTAGPVEHRGRLGQAELRSMLQGLLLGSAVYANVELELGYVSRATDGNILQT